MTNHVRTFLTSYFELIKQHDKKMQLQDIIVKVREYCNKLVEMNELKQEDVDEFCEETSINNEIELLQARLNSLQKKRNKTGRVADDGCGHGGGRISSC